MPDDIDVVATPFYLCVECEDGADAEWYATALSTLLRATHLVQYEGCRVAVYHVLGDKAALLSPDQLAAFAAACCPHVN